MRCYKKEGSCERLVEDLQVSHNAYLQWNTKYLVTQRNRIDVILPLYDDPPRLSVASRIQRLVV
jgi:hypothetical protein